MHLASTCCMCYKSFWISLSFLNIWCLDKLEFGLEQILCLFDSVLLRRIPLQNSSATRGKLFSFCLQALYGTVVSRFCHILQIHIYNHLFIFWSHAAWDWCIAGHDNTICLLRNCKFTVLNGNYVTGTLRFNNVPLFFTLILIIIYTKGCAWMAAECGESLILLG